jgi:uncharacterized membrane protein
MLLLRDYAYPDYDLRRKENDMIERRIRTLILTLMLAVSWPLLGDDIIKTSEWTDFGSYATTINGQLAPIGVLIDAYDSSDVYCGADTVHTQPGFFGAMPVYGDDTQTEDVDEGCENGDTVFFRVNGRLAQVTGDDIWRGKGPIKIIELAITQAFGLDLTGTPGDFGQPGDTVMHTVMVENTGNGIDLIDLDVLSSLGWEIVDPPVSPQYIDPGATLDLEIKVVIPAGASADVEDTVTVTAASRFNPATEDSFEAVTTVGQTFGIAVTSGPGGAGSPGDTIGYNVTLENLGNGEDSVMIEITSSGGWPVIDPPDPTQHLGPFDFLDLLVQVEIPLGTPQGTTDTLTIIVTSWNDASATDTIKVVTRVGTVYGFAVNGPTSGIADPGESIVYSPVIIQNTGGEADRVEVESFSALGWNIDTPVIPDQDVSPGGTIEVDFGVDVPLDAVIGSEDTLTIVVYSQEDDTQKDTLKIVTLVGKEYGVQISGPNAGAAIPGGSAVYNVTITNTGNVSDDVSTGVSSSSGWQWSGLPATIADLEADESRLFTVVVTAPGSSDVGDKDTLTIIVSSQGARAAADTLKIVTTVQELYGVRVSGLTSGVGEPGDEIFYEVIVENTGNITDKYSMTVTSSGNWQLGGLPPAEVEYAPDAGDVFSISVTIPETAVAGDIDTLAIHAQSQSNMSITDELLIVTTVEEKTAVADEDYIIPGRLALHQNFPNPFNLETVISFQLDKPGEVTVTIHDILGRTVEVVNPGYLPVGTHQVSWDGRDQRGQVVSSGVYFYRLTAAGASLTRKMILLK